MANNVNVKKLEVDLWESADLLRAGSKLTSNQYCMPVLGLIFLRYAYSRFKLVEQEILKDRPMRGGRVLPVEQSDFAEKSALFLPKEAQYNYLVNLPANIPEQGLTGIEGNPLNSLGEVVNNAMELVEQQSEQLQGVLPKDYTIFSDELLGELLRIFNNDALDDVGGDVIGRIYEYFLNKFAKNVAQDDGVFFTPKSLVKMIVNVLEPAHGVLLDPACGSGGMFVQTGDFVNHAGMIANNTMTFYGQEKVEYNAKLCLMNMAVHGLTDRDELNRQISDTFENCGLLGKTKASQFIASSGTDLVKKLQGNPSFVFTLIQKFNLPKEPPIYPDHDILILSDEAHRSQYGIFADNMMHLLPTASRIGFTGTPLLADDHITERTFGGYLSVYDFKRAVEDGATVPLYYENRADKIAQLDKPEITGRILDAIEAADLDPSQEEKLEREFAKEIHILTADERLRSIAKDFVEHYSDLWTSGKAMFVCLNKVTCVRMYNYVQEYWRAKIRELEARQGTATQQEAQELARKLAWMKETEMAVVISQEQNEVQTFKKWGLDILPHRAKMEKRELDKEFKDSKNPFRVVFVCAMWLTGFDVKCLSCLYLDKPLKAHTLMQTIARANRVSEGKSNGLIVDYIGIVKALRKALADYTVSKNSPAGIDPTVDKTELIQRICTVIGKTDGFLAEHGFRLQELVDAQDFEKMNLVQDAVNAMCETLETKKTFQTYASELARLFRYADRDDVDDAVRARKNAILAIYEGLQQKRKHADNTDLMVQINGIVNEYIHVEKPDQEAVPSRQFDISKIDFDLLSREFAHTRRKNLLLRDLDELVNQQLAKMLFANPQRIDYYDRYQEIIDAYNAEQNRATIEKTFMDLMELASSLDTEQQRYMREGFSSDEELSVYDLLFSENLTKQEIETIKKVSVDLLTKIKQQIAKLDHWTDKQETKAIVDNLIRKTLWQELPNSYDVSDIQTYQKKIYEYVYMRYPEVA